MDLSAALKRLVAIGRRMSPIGRSLREELARTVQKLERTQSRLREAQRQLDRTKRQLDRTARDYTFLRVPRRAVCGAIGIDDALCEEIVSATDPEHLHLMGPHRNEHEGDTGRLAAETTSGRVEVHRESAIEISDGFADSYFDWIYVGIDRRAKFVRQDLKLYYPKVKPGGCLIGGGYEDKGRKSRSKRALDEFVDATPGATLTVQGSRFVVEKGADQPATWRIPGADKELARMARRPEDASSGRLPDFLILGAQKSGTGFLYELLCQHPDVRSAIVKEVSYFSNYPEKGTAWYRSCFPVPPYGERGRPVSTGEASPNYLLYPESARRVAETAPDVKLVVLLRDPVARAYSHFNHQVRMGHEPLPTFEEALAAEDARLRWAREGLRGREHLSVNFPRFSYVARGLYAAQLAEWLEHFPGDRMLVIKSEDMFTNLEQTLAELLDFLDLSAWTPGPIEHSGSRRVTPPLDPATRERLRAFFEPYNRKLYDLIGRDFGW